MAAAPPLGVALDDLVRALHADAKLPFIEVHVNTPIATCEQRDPKGLYKKARAGEIKQFTGIDAPYEAPVDPELVVNTDRESPEESVTRIVEFLRPRFKVDFDVEI